jgi:type I restriction enzyme, S subunit
LTWADRKLGELLRVEHGFAFKGEHFTDAGDLVVLTPGNFHEQGGFRPRPGKDRFYAASFPDRYLLRKGDVIVAMTEQGEGLLGSSAVIPESDRYLHNQRLGLVKERANRANRMFVYHLFNTPHVREQIRNTSSGAKVRHTSPERIYGVSVRVPNPHEQARIAAILSAYDDLIANNQRRIALLEGMAEEIYREWFVRMRFPGYARASWSKGRPTDWTESPLGSIATFTMGQSPSSEFYNDRGEGLPFHQGVGTYGSRYPKHEVFCSEPGRQARAGDILFSVRAPVGRLNIADTGLILGRGLAAMRHKEGKQAFLYYLLRVAFAKEDVIGNGSIFSSVGKDELARFPVLLPTKDMIHRFEEIAVPIDAQLGSLYGSNERLKQTRDALLPRLISGKLKVDHLNIRLPPSMRVEADAVA